ncbi:MAG: helical backbone metal receptor [Bacteroidia bacterium]|nr:helical backbone metal receptor [Bacteroidia bacterium]
MQRIVSLCPSITETLYALDLDERVVGRTRFCIHPKDKVQSAVRLGGTKEIKFDRLHSLKPDLIIAEKEENTPEMVAEMEKHYPVFVADVTDVKSGLEMISNIGRLTDREIIANQLVERITASKAQLRVGTKNPTVLYLIWKDPIMGVGSNTYIGSMMDLLGWKNVLLKFEGRYPQITERQVADLSPDLVLLSSEPYPFKQQHINAFKALSPKSKVRLVDGEMFSWYGSRMEMAFPYMQKLQAEIFGADLKN